MRGDCSYRKNEFSSSYQLLTRRFMGPFQIRSLLLGLILSLAQSTSASTIWYVNGLSGNNTNNCLSANTACKTIRHAISLAASGDSILVAAATYKERLTIAFSLKITGTGGSPIIDGNLGGTVITIHKTAAHVTLTKLTITRGETLPGVAGAGIFNEGT